MKRAMLLLALVVVAGGALARGTLTVNDPAFIGSLTSPPTVTINSPTSAATYTTTNASETVGGTATNAPSSVTCSNAAGGSCSCTGTTSWSCTVGTITAASSNVVTVTATGPGGPGADVITITRNPPGSPSLWFDASQEAFANNDLVTTWADRGSLAKNATNAGGSFRPTFKSPCESGKLNNKPCMSFGNNLTFATGAFTSMSQPDWICVVYNPRTVTNETVFDGDDGTTRHGLDVNSGNFRFVDGSVFSGPAASANTYYTVCTVYNGASSSLRVNGSATNGSGGSHAFDGLNIGKNSGGGGFMLDGYIAEILVYDTDPTIANVEAYLSSKYGSFPQ